MQEIQRTEIARQVFFTAVPQTVLKTVGIAVNFFVPLDPSAVCANAVLPFVLARGRDFTEIKRRLDNLYGARLNSEVRKIGHSQVLTVGIETVRRRFALPGDDPVRSAARLVAELITAPPVENGRFPQADVEAEKNNVCGLIAAQENDKRTLAVNRAVSFIFDRDVYGLNKYGDVEGIKRLDGEKLYEAWQSVLKKAVVEIICVGDDAPADTAEIFAKAFAGIKRSPTVPKPIKKPKLYKQYGQVTQRMNITQAKLIVGFRTRHILPENCAALEVMNTLYGAGTTSKLFMNVREKLSLCYYCASRYSRHMGLLLVDSGVLESNAEPAEREIRAQLAAIAEGDFTDDELQQARLYLSNSFRGAGGSVGSLTAYWLSEIASGTMRSPDAAALEFEGVTRQDVEYAAAGWRTDTVYLLAPQEGQQT